MSLDRNAPHNQPLGHLARFGDAAHGVYRASTGKITTPAGVQIATPGVAPLGGDAHLIRPPGARPDTRKPDEIAADAAAGRTWLDYGIISGINNRLYGKALGGGGMPGWIYCAPDGSRWRVRAQMQSAGLSLFFYPFGAFSRSSLPGAAQSIGVPMSGISAAGESLFFHTTTGQEEPGYLLDAISSTGSKALITGRRSQWRSTSLLGQHAPAAGRATVTNGPSIWGGGPAGGAWELIISGTPPAASAVAVALVQERTVEVYDSTPFSVWERHGPGPGDWDADYSIDFVGNFEAAPGQALTDRLAELNLPGGGSRLILRPLGSYTVTCGERWLAGGYYDADDSLQLVAPLLTLSRTVTFDLTTTPGPDRATAAGRYDIEWSGGIDLIGGVSIPVSAEMHFSFESQEGTVIAESYATWFIGSTITDGPRATTIGSWQALASGRKVDGSNSYAHLPEAANGLTFGWVGKYDEFRNFVVSPQILRFSNRCWGLVAEGLGSKQGRGAVLAYFSPEQHILGPFEFALEDGPGYATAHPVTGEITASLVDSICVV
ncbi:hypothetical protein [Thauera sp.]|uniref:hypothetical protein n=1 Tax=Thauera sp. TaxID=1905334 RepID=UPI0039E4833F